MSRLAFLPVLLSLAARAAAQDPFEIHIYEFEPMLRGEYSLEAHLNSTAQGTSARDGTLLPTDGQTHLTLEPTVGLSSSLSAPALALGFMFLSAWQPGFSPEFGGWRVLPHIYLPEAWNLPVRVGFVAEFSFKTSTTKKIRAAPSFVPFSTAISAIGKPSSIRCSKGHCTAPARTMAGISNPLP